MAFDSSTALDVAATIAHHLCRTAYRHGGLCTWMGTTQGGDVDSGVLEFTYQTLGPDLYGGTSGVALFLSEVYARTGDATVREVAAGGMTHALAGVEGIPPHSRLSSYMGSVGVAYAAARAGTLLQRPDFKEAASDILGPLQRAQDSKMLLDVTAGAAGAIPALLWLAGSLDRSDLATWAEDLGRRVMGAATKDATGWSWGKRATGIESIRPLTGFAHGAAGIGWSLLALYRRTGDPAFREGGLQAFRYENQWFQADQDNWPDFRPFNGSDEPSPSCTFWCHGAPGIGLSRLGTLTITDDEQYRRDIEASIRTTKAALANPDGGPEGDFCLCHGLGGLAECLWRTGDALGDEGARQTVGDVAANGAARYGQAPERWPCGVRRGSNPSLMIGLAGIGYFYLGLADPALPSVLLIGPQT